MAAVTNAWQRCIRFAPLPEFRGVDERYDLTLDLANLKGTPGAQLASIWGQFILGGDLLGPPHGTDLLELSPISWPPIPRAPQRPEPPHIVPLEPPEPLPPAIPPPDPKQFLQPRKLTDLLIPGRRRSIEQAEQADFDAAYRVWQSKYIVREEAERAQRLARERAEARRAGALEIHAAAVAEWEKCNSSLGQRVQAAQILWLRKKQEFERLRAACLEEADFLREAYARGDGKALERLIDISLKRHGMLQFCRRAHEVHVDVGSEATLIEIGVPDLTSINLAAPGARVAAKDLLATRDTILAALLIRAAVLAAKTDTRGLAKIVAVNAKMTWIDPASGREVSGIVGSVQASRAVLVDLNPQALEPRQCLRSLRGIVTPSIATPAVVRPIMEMSRDDWRIVASRDVEQEMTPEANLASMPWEDFEQLVRQLFEVEFASTGAEVRVTRASRDWGVDAIVYDPDPLRGGKFIIQAKRYTQTVDFAAVRELYGIVVSEGANRGLLVTTSQFGPDAREFAKDKPISLVDGANLIAICRKHGRNYRIDLGEARAAARIGTSTD